MTKALKKLENDGMYLNIRKAIYEKTCSQYHTKWGKMEIISTKVRYETRVFILPNVIQYSAGIPSKSNKARERNKGDSNRGRRSQIIAICR
jgi:hypothetical protein